MIIRSMLYFILFSLKKWIGTRKLYMCIQFRPSKVPTLFLCSAAGVLICVILYHITHECFWENRFMQITKRKRIFSSVVLTCHWKVYQGFWKIYIRQLRWQVNIVLSFGRFASSSLSMVQSLEETCHSCALGLKIHTRMTQINNQDMLQWLLKEWNLGDCCS